MSLNKRNSSIELKDEEKATDFYRLHYPQKKDSTEPLNRFRAKSVLSVTEK